LAAALAGAAAGLATAATPTPPPTTTAATATTGQPSPLIYPAEEIPLAFDHALHARAGARCESCHADALTSTSAGDALIAPEASCRPCHAIDRTQPEKAVAPGRPAARCDACHVGWMPGPADIARAEPPRVRLARPNLKFNHRLHAERGIGCELCHASSAMQAMTTRADLPMMALCLACHDGRRATARCGACHVTEPDGRLKVALASPATIAAGGTGKLVPSGVLRGVDGHGPTFRTGHAQAGRDEGYCLSCHRRSECIDCHGGVVRPPDIHPSDYVSLHPADARRNTPDCSACHRLQSFCIGCHQRAGVASDPAGGVPGRPAQNPFGTGTQLKRFHPPGWVRDASGAVIGNATPSSHSLQAKRNIRACASCHREETCLACHSSDPTRGLGVSPHGPRFGATARCKAMSSRNRRACLKCHALGSPEIDCESP
jgi:hypothetical protein